MSNRFSGSSHRESTAGVVDTVAMEAEFCGRLKNGRIYNNLYHFQHALRDRKLVSIREYLDTQHVQDVFGFGDAG